MIYQLPPTSRAEERRQQRAHARRRITARARRREHRAQEPNAARVLYVQLIRKLAKSLWDEIVAAKDLRTDAASDPLRIKILERARRSAEGIASAVADKTSKSNAREMRRLVGIDPRVDPGTGPVIDAFRQENVRLIESIAEDQLLRVENIIKERLAGRVEDLAVELKKNFEITESRANLIARDQTLKLNGQLTKIRQQNSGIEEYIWTTSGDERVREEHAELEGTRQRWDTPPLVGHPGEDFQCRCTAFPVIPGLDEETDES